MGFTRHCPRRLLGDGRGDGGGGELLGMTVAIIHRLLLNTGKFIMVVFSMLQPLVLWEVIEESVSTLLTAISVLKWDKHGE